MKYLQRLFCALLVVAILSVTFSTTVGAESNSDYYINFNLNYSDNYIDRDVQLVFPSDENQMVITNADFSEGDTCFDFEYIIKSSSNDILAKKNRDVNFTFSNVHWLIQYNNKWVYLKDFEDKNLLVSYTDGSQEYFDYDYSYSSGGSTITSTFKPAKDVKQIRVLGYYFPRDYEGKTQFIIEYGTGSSYSPNVDIEIQSQEAGLLSGLINWVKGIFDSIGDGFKSMGEGFTNIFNKLTEGFSNMISKLTEGFTNIVNSLIELPQKLWILISDGLKNLFVPDAEYMADYSEEWDTLLSSRFGAIYEVGDIISNFASNIKVSATTQTIYLPTVNLNSVGIPFSFGGYDIRVVPEGFNSIVNVCKSIISIVCTFLFINGLRKRYDEVMGVEQ